MMQLVLLSGGSDKRCFQVTREANNSFLSLRRKKILRDLNGI